MFEKKKKTEEEFNNTYEERDFESDDQNQAEEEEAEQQPRSKQVERVQQHPRQLTKEEVGALAQYHQSRALELLGIYRTLE